MVKKRVEIAGARFTRTLPVMEHFLTLQGEGFHAGKAAYFIRLAGCNVGCHWCDVKESWSVVSEQWSVVSDMVNEAKNSGAPIAVITGGEPTMYPLDELTEQLKKAGLLTHLETSGAYPITGTFDWLCVSPKKTKPPLSESLKRANELKIIIYNKDDFKWAEKNALGVKKDCKLFLQPEWSKINIVTPWITDYIKHHPRWRISLQIHKFLNIP